MRIINIYAYRGDTRSPDEVMAEEVTREYEQLYKKKSATHAVCIFRYDVRAGSAKKRLILELFKTFYPS